MINDIDYLFKCLLHIHVSSLGQCPGVHSLRSVRPFMTPWTAGSLASLSFTICHSLLKPLSNEPMMPSNHLTLCLSSSPPPSVFPNQGLFQWVVTGIRPPKYWSFWFSIGPSNDYSGSISFRIDWFDLLAARWTRNSLRQDHSSKSNSSLVLNLLYGPSLTSGQIYWWNHSLDYGDLCQQIDVHVS